MVECSRRDDLESLAYMLIYFMRGTLPWRKIRDPDAEKTWNLIRDKKLETEEFLTVGLPAEFDIFYKYVRGLEFDDLPDYDGLRGLFRGLAEKHHIEYDWVFDWSVPKPNERKRKRKCRSCHACSAAAEAAKAATALRRAS